MSTCGAVPEPVCWSTNERRASFSAGKDVAQAVLLETLRLCGKEDGGFPKDEGPEVAVQIASVLMQLLAVPPTAALDGRTAADAVEGLQEAQLTWEHLSESSIEQAGIA